MNKRSYSVANESGFADCPDPGCEGRVRADKDDARKRRSGPCPRCKRTWLVTVANEETIVWKINKT